MAQNNLNGAKKTVQTQQRVLDKYRQQLKQLGPTIGSVTSQHFTITQQQQSSTMHTGMPQQQHYQIIGR